MTHFSVLVLTPTKPTAAMLRSLMAPYKEFDGEDTAFVRDVDITEKTRADHHEYKQRALKSPDGGYHSVSDERFYRLPTLEEVSAIEKGRSSFTFSNIKTSGNVGGLLWESRDWNDGSGVSIRVLEIPEGWELTEVPFSELMPFEQFIEYWHSFSKLSQGEAADFEDVHASGYYVTGDSGTKVYRRCNPDGYWDWYEVGGRFNGELRVLRPDEGVEAEDHWTGEAPLDGFDIAQRSNLDVETMRANAVRGRREWIDGIAEKAGLTFDELERGLRHHSKAQDKWLELPEPRPRGDERNLWMTENVEGWDLASRIEQASYTVPKLPETMSLEEFINDVVPITAHAVIKDGKWVQRGRVGMFASIHDVEMSGEEWRDLCWKLVDELPGQHWITVIDCHV